MRSVLAKQCVKSQLIVVCGSGYRSSITSSLLQQRGYQEVWNTLGGMTAWQEAGLPMVQPEQEAGAASETAPRALLEAVASR